MHNMAMALHNKGIRVTGSDDEIFEPSRSRLEKYGLLPERTGWDPDRITPELDGVILGMHAKEDNPELIRAQMLRLKIWSFPEYIYEQCREKKRVVIGGSHGKTTVTSMIMHVLRYNHFDFDYMVGSQLEGFETMVRLTKDAPIVILEGDEYLSSPIDRRPKFHLYHPHIAVLTGIAWDHVNVFPTFENYKNQFSEFVTQIDPSGHLFCYSDDQLLQEIGSEATCETTFYDAHPFGVTGNETFLETGSRKMKIPVFGKHNMQNIRAAQLVCRELGVTDEQFYEAIPSFRGAARRQELLAESEEKKIYLDFAHAPSKVRATIESFRERWPKEQIYAFLEIHTFSSLNKDFLPQYENSLEKADTAYVFYDPHVVEFKNLPPLEKSFVSKSFGSSNVIVLDDKYELRKIALNQGKGIYLMMSSGSFSGLDLKDLASEIVKKN